MENNDFKVKIIDFYKEIDKPIINNIYKDNFGKNVLEFSTINEVPIFKKDKEEFIRNEYRNHFMKENLDGISLFKELMEEVWHPKNIYKFPYLEGEKYC